MKIFILIAIMQLTAIVSMAQSTDTTKKNISKKPMLVEASCGQCQFGLAGNGCNLAVRLNGKAYFVEGSGLDDHGDAHAEDGFCNVIRKAKVQGQVKNEKFVATYFKVIPAQQKKVVDRKK